MAAASIGRSSDIYAACFQVLPQELVIFDSTGRIQDINNAALKLFQYPSSGDLKQRNIEFLIPQFECSTCSTDLEELKKSKGTASNPNLLREKEENHSYVAKASDGTTFEIVICFSKIGESERPLFIASISRETVPSRVQKILRIVQSLTLKTDNLIFFEVDEACNFTWLSEGFEKLTGYPKEAWIGKKLFELLTPDCRAKLTPYFRALQGDHKLSKPTIPQLIQWTKSDGSVLHLKVMGLDMEDGTFFHIGINVDGEVKKEQLQRELLIEKEEKYLAMHQALQVFSHRLKTPIHSLTLLLFTLLKDSETGPTHLTEEQHEMLKAAEVSTSELTYIMEIFSLLINLECRQTVLQRSNFRIAEVFERLAKKGNQLALQKGLTFSLTTDPSIPEVYTGDMDSLLICIYNLIKNAAAYTRAGHINVCVTYQKMPNTPQHKLIFTVQDTGIGVPPEHQEKIFDIFYTIPSIGSETRKGVGLTIARHLAVLMGGDVKLKRSIEGRGSTFSLEARLTNPIDSPMASPRSTLIKKPKVLVAEDNPINRRMLLQILTTHGYVCVEAEDGNEALRKLEQEPFDLVLMDIQMPNKDGDIASLEWRLKEDLEGGQHVPIIAVTANLHDQKLTDRCEKARIDHIITKPCSWTTLRDAIKRQNIWVPPQRDAGGSS